MQTITNIAAADQHAAYFAAVANAERRAMHSYFDQHVVEDDELGFLAIDEGDYGALGQAMIDRILNDRGGAAASPLFLLGEERSRGASSPP